MSLVTDTTELLAMSLVHLGPLSRLALERGSIQEVRFDVTNMLIVVEFRVLTIRVRSEDCVDQQ